MPAVGIDLGTTYSCIAAFVNGNVEVISNDQGNRFTPSVVMYKDTGKVVGEGAYSELDPKNTIYEVKRLIGRSIDDRVVQDDMKLWPFTVASDNGTDPKVRVRYHGQDMLLSPEQVSASVLETLKQNAEAYLGHEVKDAVITVPAYFNDAQRRATKSAGEIAGLNVLRIINEPTAAGIAYGYSRDFQSQKTILIYDLGGGTFDVSILKAKGNDFDVLAIDGDTHLGGSDFDVLMTKHFIEDFKRKSGIDISNDDRAKARLRRECEKSKRRFAFSPLVTVAVEHLAENQSYKGTMMRSVFDNLCGELFQKTIDKVRDALKAAKLSPADIDDVVLVGGSTRIVKIQALLGELFAGKELTKAINPDEAVAIGAAHMAAQLTADVSDAIRRLNVHDVTARSLGFGVHSDVSGHHVKIMIPKNSRIPAVKTKDRFSNRYTDQESVSIKIYHGEEKVPKKKNLIGKFSLDITRCERHKANIEVAFSYDENGILIVRARDVQLNNWREITIEYKTGKTTEKERARMVVDAKRFRLLDRKEHERQTAIIDLETQVRTTQQAIADNEFKSRSRTSPATVSQRCETLLEWIEDNQEASMSDITRQKAAFDALL